MKIIKRWPERVVLEDIPENKAILVVDSWLLDRLMQMSEELEMDVETLLDMMLDHM